MWRRTTGIADRSSPLHQVTASATIGARQPVGFPNWDTGVELGFYAARSYSLMRPPRTGRRLIRCRDRSAAG
jgi:hypothetical protein